jgi:hypothetical protein
MKIFSLSMMSDLTLLGPRCFEESTENVFSSESPFQELSNEWSCQSGFDNLQQSLKVQSSFWGVSLVFEALQRITIPAHTIYIPKYFIYLTVLALSILHNKWLGVEVWYILNKFVSDRSKTREKFTTIGNVNKSRTMQYYTSTIVMAWDVTVTVDIISLQAEA